MLKKFIIILISMLLESSISFANPVPVFCLAGWIDACKGAKRVTERDYGTNKPLKDYDFFGSSIIERDYNTNTPLKDYDID